MLNFNFTTTEPPNVFKYTEITGDHNETMVEGHDYQSTSDVTLNALLLFIERDLYLAMKNDELPCFKFRLKIDEYDQRSIKVKPYGLHDLSLLANILPAKITSKAIKINDNTLASEIEKTYEDLVKYVSDKIYQILWRYNLMTENHTNKSVSMRFHPKIEINKRELSDRFFFMKDLRKEVELILVNPLKAVS